MSIASADRRTVAVGRPLPPAARQAAAVAVRLVRRGTVVVALTAGGLAAFVAVEYRDTFSGAIGASSLMSLAENPAIRTLFGRPVALDDPGGFTVWRTGTVLAVLVGVWAALTATRITRGEEEAGRWDLLLAGRMRLGALIGGSMAVLVTANALVGAAVAGGLLLAGTATTGAVLFGAAIGGVGLVGAGLGLLAAQVVPERRAASGLAVGVLMAGLLVRMVADGVDALVWAHWVSPFGLLARTAPYSDDSVLPVLVLLVAGTVLAAVAAALSGRRDVGAGLVRGSDIRRTRGLLLGSLPALAVRRIRRPLLGWGSGVAAYFLLIGLLATSMLDFLRENPAFAQLASAAGFARLASVQGYAASLFSLLAIPLGAFCASRVAAAASDETAGRLTLLFSLPVARARWAATEAGCAVAGCAVIAAAAGVTTWVGTRAVDAPLGLGEALAGALSVLPVAMLCLGAALAALGLAPHAVIALGVLPAAGGYFLLVFAESFRWPDWVRALSPFAHVAAVPAEPMDVGGAIGMLVVAALLAVVGLTAYARRDLRG